MSAVESSNEPAALRRVRFVVAYDGAPFRGFAVNDGVPTVAGALNETLSTITRMPVEVTGAGRTDTGVHAWGQVVSFDAPATCDPADLARRVNSMLGPDIAVRSAEWADEDFHARFSASYRHYRYTVLNSPTPNPFLADRAWHVHRPLALPALQLACDPLIGEHDFTSFCRAPQEPGASMFRRVFLARWTDVTEETGYGDGPVLRFEIRANAFCHQMVRSIVGMMIQVGHGKLHAGDVRTIMRGGDRTPVAALAPPHGLNLWEVGYGERIHIPVRGR